jgi:hypothetical protein
MIYMMYISSEASSKVPPGGNIREPEIFSIAPSNKSSYLFKDLNHKTNNHQLT